MKHYYLIALLVLPLTLQAKIWIVDSNPGSASKDFTNLQAAHDGASVGDSLYLIGSGVSYITTTVTIMKRLVILGPGYFLNNPDTQVSLLSAFLLLETGLCGSDAIIFAGGSEGSVVSGLTIFGSITLSVNNILLRRNRMSAPIAGGCPKPLVTVAASNIIIGQNYFTATVVGGSYGQCIGINPGFSTIRIINNYLFNNGGGFENVRSSGSGLEVSNNTSNSHFNVTNALVQNNIFYAGGVLSATTSVIRNNIHHTNGLPTDNGNINNVLPTTIFIGTGTTDGQWKLKTGSPALGTGFDGTDMGMYGGDEPYILSGIPPIPTIYGLTAPAAAEKNTGLPVQIKVKSNN